MKLGKKGLLQFPTFLNLFGVEVRCITSCDIAGNNFLTLLSLRFYLAIGVFNKTTLEHIEHSLEPFTVLLACHVKVSDNNN